MLFSNSVPPYTGINIAINHLSRDPYFAAVKNTIKLDGEFYRIGVSNIPERLIGLPVRIEYLEGYGPEDMNKIDFVCLMTDAMAGLYGARLGDTVEITEEHRSETGYSTVTDSEPYKLIGRISYTDQDGGDWIIIPPRQPYTELFGSFGTYDAVEVSLADNSKLDEFLKASQSWAAFKTTLVMNTGELDVIKENIRFLDIIFPIAAAVLSLAAGFMPGLMILQSAKESAVLRILGAAKNRARQAAALRQLALFVPGMAAGLLAVALYNGPEVIRLTWPVLALCAALDLGCCAAVSAVCAAAVTGRRALELLQTKE
jgi:hypothetical protein